MEVVPASHGRALVFTPPTFGFAARWAQGRSRVSSRADPCEEMFSLPLRLLLQSTANNVEAKYGIFFVRPVPGWSTWWVPFQSTVCTIAQNVSGGKTVEDMERRVFFCVVRGRTSRVQLSDLPGCRG